ncbi:MAG: ABC transporter ATP-binding protein [Balneolales bacterium]|nr:ABC transporter ATP-binding protein [Balneolales bacterium]
MLEANSLTKIYSGFTALSDLSLQVNEGEIYCLLGANGAGKSTTINLFLNFIEADSGTAYVNGLNVSEKPVESKKHITYIPENLSLYKNLSGLENLAFFCGLSGMKLDDAALRETLTAAGLQPDAADKKAGQYSKGMRQKVGIALAMARNTKVLLLDEPTSGLDPAASNEFAELLRKMRDQGAAVLMATHDLFRAKETGNKIGIMSNGKLVEEQPTSSLTHQQLERLYLSHLAN